MSTMKVAKALLLFAFLFYGAVSLVSAEVAMSVPYLKENTFQMDDVTTEFTFILLNTANAQTTAKVRFAVPKETGVEINGNFTDAQTYVLAPLEHKQVAVEIDPDGRMIFPLVYGSTEVKSLSGGVSFDVWVDGSFDVNVGNCTSHCYDWVEEEELDEPKKKTTNSNSVPDWYQQLNKTSAVSEENQSVVPIAEGREMPIVPIVAIEEIVPVEPSEIKAFGFPELTSGVVAKVRDTNSLTMMIVSIFLIASIGGFIMTNYKKDEIKEYLKGDKE